MYIYELIEQLKKIEDTFGGLLPVHVRTSELETIELFGIIPEKDDEGEYILVLE